jgi:hypothetical protein
MKLNKTYKEIYVIEKFIEEIKQKNIFLQNLIKLIEQFNDLLVLV